MSSSSAAVTAPAPSAPPARTSPRGVFARLGLVRSLVAVVLVAVVAAVAVSQAVAIRTFGAREMEAAQRALDVNLAVLRRTLGVGEGAAWRLEGGDGGTLSLGGAALNGREDAVDAVRAVAGGNATIFAGDTRVATSVRRADGTRAVGTKLAAGPVREAVLGRGETYRGPADILGVPHLTIYEPVGRDAATGRPAGILYVGVPLTEAHAATGGKTRTLLLVGLGTVVAVGVAAWLLMRAALRPLGDLAAAVRRVAEGDLAAAVPHAGRADADRKSVV